MIINSHFKKKKKKINNNIMKRIVEKNMNVIFF